MGCGNEHCFQLKTGHQLAQGLRFDFGLANAKKGITPRRLPLYGIQKSRCGFFVWLRGCNQRYLQAFNSRVPSHWPAIIMISRGPFSSCSPFVAALFDSLSSKPKFSFGRTRKLRFHGGLCLNVF